MKNPVAQKLGHGEVPRGSSVWGLLWLSTSAARLGNGGCHWARRQQVAGVSRGGGEEAQESELCQKAESRAGELCCQSNMDEPESGKSWAQSSLVSRKTRFVLF